MTRPEDERDAPPERGSPEQRPGLDRFLRPFFEEPGLWPVVLAAAGIFVTLGTGIVLFALLERNPFALAALGILALMSLDVIWRDARRRRLGTASRGILALWAAIAAAALAAVRLGFF